MNIQSAQKWSLRQFLTNSIIDLEPLKQTEVGRSVFAGVYLHWNHVSPRHAAFIVNCYGNLLLRDLLSSSGTYVNTKLLKGCVNEPLRHGDIISFAVSSYCRATTDEMKKCVFQVVGTDVTVAAAVAAKPVPAGKDLKEALKDGSGAGPSKKSEKGDKPSAKGSSGKKRRSKKKK